MQAKSSPQIMAAMTWRTHWKTYLIEAWALGTFMISACLFTILLQHPGSPVHAWIASPAIRRILMGAAMGLTLVGLVYSRWGRKSGAHMNPAVTLAHLQMQRISWPNALGYMLAQFAGGLAGVMLLRSFIPELLKAMEVQYAVTTTGRYPAWLGFAAEFGISFIMLTFVLWISNSRYARYTGWCAGLLVMLFITFESPVSGMSMNPARSLASAWPAGHWTHLWIYFTAPVAGMLMAGWAFRYQYRKRHDGNCLSMKCHFSGQKHDCETYEVLGPLDLLHTSQYHVHSGKKKPALLRS